MFVGLSFGVEPWRRFPPIEHPLKENNATFVIGIIEVFFSSFFVVFVSFLPASLQCCLWGIATCARTSLPVCHKIH